MNNGSNAFTENEKKITLMLLSLRDIRSITDLKNDFDVLQSENISFEKAVELSTKEISELNLDLTNIHNYEDFREYASRIFLAKSEKAAKEFNINLT